MGRLQKIWRKRASGGPMDPLEVAELRAGHGIVENSDVGGKRQVTLLSEERWRLVCEELGAEVDPVSRRANFLVSGIDLEDCRGAVVRLGEVRVRILGETRPCRLMDELHPGLQKALDPHWGGGAYGEVLDDGTVSVGDEVDLEASESV